MEKGNIIAKEKRKRGEREAGEEAAPGRKRVVREEEEEEVEVEVEEFFAIVRRMQVAVEYFDRGNINGQTWRAALESVAGDGGGRQFVGKEEEEKGVAKGRAEPDPREVAAAEEDEEEEERGVFDLNTVPPVTG